MGFICSLLASSVRLLTRSSALCFREKRVEEVSLHFSLVPQAVGVLSRGGVGLWKGRKTDKSHGGREALCRHEALLERASQSPGRQGCLQALLPAAWLSPILRCSHSLSLLPGCLEGQGQTCTPHYGQVPGSCLHCCLVCLRAERRRCRPAWTLHGPQPCGSVSEAGSSGWERARKPRIAPPRASSPQVLLGSGF